MAPKGAQKNRKKKTTVAATTGNNDSSGISDKNSCSNNVKDNAATADLHKGGSAGCSATSEPSEHLPTEEQTPVKQYSPSWWDSGSDEKGKLSEELQVDVNETTAADTGVTFLCDDPGGGKTCSDSTAPLHDSVVKTLSERMKDNLSVSPHKINKSNKNESSTPQRVKESPSKHISKESPFSTPSKNNSKSLRSPVPGSSKKIPGLMDNLVVCSPHPNAGIASPTNPWFKSQPQKPPEAVNAKVVLGDFLHLNIEEEEKKKHPKVDSRGAVSSSPVVVVGSKEKKENKKEKTRQEGKAEKAHKEQGKQATHLLFRFMLRICCWLHIYIVV